MPRDDETVQGLRDALEISPENVPLRLHLARTLVGLGRFQEAEREYRELLMRTPEDVDVKLALATVYLQQDKLERD